MTPRWQLNRDPMGAHQRQGVLIAQTQFADVWSFGDQDPWCFSYAVCYGPGTTYWFDILEEGIADMHGELLGHVPDEHWDQLRAIFALQGLS